MTQRTTYRIAHVLMALLLSVAAAFAAPADHETEINATLPETNDAVTSDATYALGPGDVIEVFVWKEPELTTTVTVLPDGRIALPLVGDLQAAGKTTDELESEAVEKLHEFVEQPVVSIIVKEVNSPKISVLGEVRRPGRHLIQQGTTVLDAIAMSGGFTEFAHRNRVTVIRQTADGLERIPVHVKRLLEKGGTAFYLEPGDTVHVD